MKDSISESINEEIHKDSYSQDFDSISQTKQSIPKVPKIDPTLVALEKKYLGTTTLDKPWPGAQEFDAEKLFEGIAKYENVCLTNELYLRMENITLSKLMEKDKVTVALMLANKEL